MAKQAKQTNTKTRRGRPTNAERNDRIQSQNAFIIDAAMAAASAAVKSALGTISGSNVVTLGASGGSDQSSASDQASGSAGTPKSRRAPGRKVDSTSMMSQTREFFAKNKNSMPRAELVKAAAAKFGYTPQTGNTYISKISKDEGFTFPTSRGNTRTH